MGLARRVSAHQTLCSDVNFRGSRYTIPVTTLDTLHALIDSLPEGSLDDASRTLTELRDDRWAWLQRNAEIDDEVYTDEEMAQIQESVARAHEDILAGRTKSNEEVGRMLDALCEELSSGQPTLSATS